MENIERTQFVVLTGHLDEYPLPELIRRLRVQRKSGRLQVEYPDSPGAFFFEDGQMVDAHLGSLRGVEALYAALSLEGASFNFNPLVRPPERNIDRQGQQFIRDLVEAPRREGLADIKAATRDAEDTIVPALPHKTPLQLPPAAEIIAPLEERLSAVEEAITTTSTRFSRERMIYAAVISFLVGLSLVMTLGTFYGPFFSPEPTAPTALQTSAPAAPASQAQQPATTAQGSNTSRESNNASANAGQTAEQQAQPPVPTTAALIGTRRASGVPASQREYVVQVLVEVKNGRVTDARVWNPRPGASAHEAVALKMAKERTYPEGFTGAERLRIRVKP